MKSLLTTRPIWHKCLETIRGHVFCTYLALVLHKAREDRLEAAGIGEKWPRVLSDLGRFSHVAVENYGKRFRIRSSTSGWAGKVLLALSPVAPPSLGRTAAEEGTS